MMDWTPHSNFTDEELIREHRVSDDSIVHELANRLADAIDEPADQIEQLEAHVDELENATCDECEKHEAEVERLEDEHEDRIAKLDEQIAHERERIKEFYDENQQFIAEIERLKKELQSAKQTPTRKDTTMLEQQIEKLAERIGTVETKLDTTNELLAEILTAIRDGGSVPPAPAKATKAPKAAKGKAKVEVVANDDADEATAQEAGSSEATTGKQEKQAAKAADPVDIEGVREALMAVKENYGREAAVEIVEKFANGIHKVGDIPEDKYSDVLAACDALDQKEAA